MPDVELPDRLSEPPATLPVLTDEREPGSGLPAGTGMLTQVG